MMHTEALLKYAAELQVSVNSMRPDEALGPIGTTRRGKKQTCHLLTKAGQLRGLLQSWHVEQVDSDCQTVEQLLVDQVTEKMP